MYKRQSLYPATFLGLHHEIGRIAPGFRANLVLADERLNVLDTWIDGQSASGMKAHPVHAAPAAARF